MKNLDFCQNFGKCGKSQLWSKFSQNSDFVQNLGKFQVWIKFEKNLDFGQNLRKIQFLSKMSQISIMVKISEKFRF